MIKDILILVALVCLLGASAVMGFVLRKQRAELEQLYDGFAYLTGIAQKHTEKLDALGEFEKRFNEVIAEMEWQNEQEAKWNEGLNNILDYSLVQAFGDGGTKK